MLWHCEAGSEPGEPAIDEGVFCLDKESCRANKARPRVQRQISLRHLQNMHSAIVSVLISTLHYGLPGGTDGILHRMATFWALTDYFTASTERRGCMASATQRPSTTAAANTSAPSRAVTRYIFRAQLFTVLSLSPNGCG